ncbi:MAG: hypothetical protein ACK4TA_12490 [Saprospiraceae bacterium]
MIVNSWAVAMQLNVGKDNMMHYFVRMNNFYLPYKDAVIRSGAHPHLDVERLEGRKGYLLKPLQLNNNQEAIGSVNIKSTADLLCAHSHIG